jgi:hypothetical protein
LVGIYNSEDQAFAQAVVVRPQFLVGGYNDEFIRMYLLEFAKSLLLAGFRNGT